MMGDGPGCLERERICWGIEGSNPPPSSGESTTNCSGAGADSPARRRGDDPRCANVSAPLKVLLFRGFQLFVREFRLSKSSKLVR